jgi:hypothetical protein
VSNTKKDKKTQAIEEFFDFQEVDERWSDVIVGIAKKQVAEMETADEWADIIGRWKWWESPHPWIVETLNMLAKVPAASAYVMAIKYVFYKKIDDSKMRRKDFQVLAGRFRRAFTYLYQAGLIKGEPITPEEIGPGRRSVTIWVAPFANSYDKMVAREFYLKHTEGRSGKAGKNKKALKEVSEYNRKVKVESILDKYKENPHLNNWFMCPKKHPSGLTYRTKLNLRYKRKIALPKCPECDRELIIISHEEFMEKMKKKLYKEYDLKN